MRIEPAPRETYPWIAERTGCALTDDFRAIAATSHGRIRGMVAYCNWTQYAVQLHMAVDAPIVWRSLLVPALSYPFVQCKRGICLGIIPASNSTSVRFAKRAGFQEVFRLRDGWAIGDDLVMLELRAENCRFIPKEERS